MRKRSWIKSAIAAGLLTLVAVAPGSAEIVAYGPGGATTQSGWCRTC